MNQSNGIPDDQYAQARARQLVEHLQLNAFVKEYQEINDYISSIVIKAAPERNAGIIVAGGVSPPQGMVHDKNVFNILIEYISVEGKASDILPTEKRIGDHVVYAGFSGEKMTRYISIALNAKGSIQNSADFSRLFTDKVIKKGNE